MNAKISDSVRVLHILDAIKEIEFTSIEAISFRNITEQPPTFYFIPRTSYFLPHTS